jgi:hypothetical protein
MRREILGAGRISLGFNAVKGGVVQQLGDDGGAGSSSGGVCRRRFDETAVVEVEVRWK